MKRSMLAACISVVLFSCKRDITYQSGNTSTVMVINCATNVPQISLMLSMNGKLNTSGISSTSNISKINFGTGGIFFSPKKSVALSILNGTDTSVLFTNNYNLGDNSLFSLFIAGQAPNLETVFVKESNYPYLRQDIITGSADSIINIRFVNLSPNTNPLSIRMQGASVDDVTGLAYKDYSAFQAYAAKIANASYKFEIVENGIVLTTFTLSVTGTNRFRNVAVVVRGLKGGNPALGVSAVNYF